MKGNRMRILVTGGAGFIGSHIVDRLVERSHEIVIVDNISTGRKSNLNPKAKFYDADILDVKRLNEIFDNERPSHVIHAAADIKVRKSVENPMKNAMINIMGSLNVLDCCKEFEIKKMVYLCTGGAIYGDPKSLPAAEDTPIMPISPYGISKYAFELYLDYYHDIHGVDFVSLRFSNIYGPRDRIESNHVIPVFIRSLLDNKAPMIQGDGSQARDFVYVDDVVDAVMLALEKSPERRYLNIGSGELIRIKTLFSIIARLLGKDIKPWLGKGIKGEVVKICLDIKNAKKELGWESKTGLEEGLEKTIKWLKEN